MRTLTVLSLLLLSTVYAAAQVSDGVASFNASDTETASGEKFDPESMTAAHKTLPFNTLVRVTNKKNDKSVVVRINDRGPFKDDRTIDVTIGAARLLGMVSSGLAPVSLEVIGKEVAQEKPVVKPLPKPVIAAKTNNEHPIPVIAHGRERWVTRTKIAEYVAEPMPLWEGLPLYWWVMKRKVRTKLVWHSLPLWTYKPDAVEQYLCDVYWRMPKKVDSSGDFTWKDPDAAHRKHLSTCEYVVRGMHPDLREGLYAIGKAADAKSIQWTMLSGFRDDYRQHIASGFKASDCGSYHGGSCTTNGYGDGRAVDVWALNDQTEELFKLIDRMDDKTGLSRPMEGIDPAHVQVSSNWHRLASNLRNARIGGDEAVELLAVNPDPPKVVHKVHVAKKVRHHRRRHDDDDD